MDTKELIAEIEEFAEMQGESQYIWKYIESAKYHIKYTLNRPRKEIINALQPIGEFQSMLMDNIRLCEKNGHYIPVWHILKMIDIASPDSSTTLKRRVSSGQRL